MDDFEKRVTEAAVALLRETGPLAEQRWIELIVKRGITDLGDAEDLVEHLDHPMVGGLVDGRMVAVDSLVDERVLTHRLSAPEIDHDILALEPDLDPLTDLVEPSPGFALAYPGLDAQALDERGGPEQDRFRNGAVLLEPGTLAGRRPGDLIGLRAEGGRVRLEFPAEERLADPADLAAALGAIVPADTSEMLDWVVWQAMADDPTTFSTPTAPLTELLARAGLDRRVDFVAHAGFDFEAERRNRAITHHAVSAGLDRPTATTVYEIVRLAKLAPPQLPGAIGAVLDADPHAFDGLDEFASIPALLGDIDGGKVFDHLDLPASMRPPTMADLHAVALELIRRVPRRARAGAHHLAGRTALRLGRGDAADLHFRDTVAADESWAPAYRDAASIAMFRGDLTGAMALFARVPGGTDEGVYRLLTDITEQQGPALGRNERCWCGSGRKYKVCHLGRPALDAAGQADLLHHKALEFVRTSEFVDDLLDLAEFRSGFGDYMPVEAVLDDGVVFDALLFEGGVFAAFVERVGDLLPADEQLMAAQWLLGERSVYEVEAVGAGAVLSLRDVRSGDRVELTAEPYHHQPAAGEFVCTRLVTAGDALRAYGGLEPVAAALRGELITLLDDPDGPEALVELFSRRLAPPHVLVGGNELIFCSARFQVVDTAGIRRRLSRRYGKGEDDQWVWLEGTSVRGHLGLETRPDGGLELVVEAMNEPRFDALLAAVHEMDPEARLLGEERNVPDLSGPSPEVAAPGGPAPAEDLPPEAMEAVAQFIRGHEQAWIDEQIPALGGHTPRECAADPTRRDDLIRLLDSFPQADVPGAMSAKRLRVMLGL